MTTGGGQSGSNQGSQTSKLNIQMSQPSLYFFMILLKTALVLNGDKENPRLDNQI